MRLTNSIKQLILTSMHLLKVHELFRFLNRKKAVVIMYHGVTEKELSPFAWTQMPVQKFEQQIEYVSKKYHVLPLTTIAEKLINKEKLPDYSLAITFDDGFKNNYSTAFPVLKRFNLPATIFLTTCNISSNGLLWFDRLYLAIKETKKTELDLSEEGMGSFSIATPDEKNQTLSALFGYMKGLQKNEKDLLLSKVLNKLGMDSMEIDDANPFKSLDWEDIIPMQQSNLISFGAHTETHNIMTRIPGEEVLQEIEVCKKKIEEKLGNKCLLFAFPNGQKDDFNNEIKDAVKNSGFFCALTTIGKFNEYGTDPYELGRFPIGSDVDEQYLKLLISGAIGFLSKIANRFVSSPNPPSPLEGEGGEPIRVMHLNASVQIGGAEKVIMTLSKCMKDTAFDSIVASFVTHGESASGDGQFIKESKMLGIETRIITTKKMCRFTLSELIKNLFSLCHLLRKENIKLLHTHGYKADIIGLAAAKILNIPIVSTAHGWTSCSKNVRLYEFLDRLALRFFDKIIVVSDSIKNTLLNSRISAHKIEKTYNTVDCEMVKNNASLNEVRKRFHLSQSDKLVGAIGRLSKEKGVDYLLNAGSEIIAKYPDVKILIIGDGPERQNLETLAKQLLISKNVIFCGFQENVTEFYRLIDIVVLPSITEGLPMVLLEALTYSKPVVATRVGGIPEVITDGKTGILVEPQNPSRLAEGIIRILKNPEEANRMALEGRKLVEEHFNSKDWGKKIEKFYQKILGTA